MIKLNLVHNEGYPWYKSEGIYVKGKCLNALNEVLEGEALIHHFKDIEDESDFVTQINALNGLFVVVLLRKNKLMAAVDRLRNFPLLYSIENDKIMFSDDYKAFISSPISDMIDQDTKKEMLQLGYVLENKTLLKHVNQLVAAQYIIIDKTNIKISFYYKLHPSIYNLNGKDAWKRAFCTILLEIGERLSQMIGDNFVALPLSGGFDSRLIGLLLKLYGHKKVYCFSYGNETTAEAQCSKKVAGKLNYPWLFVDYKDYIGENYTQTQQFQDYIDYVGNASAFPYIQEYFAAKYLKEQKKWPENTIFIPGHSGDMLGGSHLYPDMSHFNSTKLLSKKIIRTNGNQIPVSQKDRKLLLKAIAKSTNPELVGYSHLLHDDWNITERQSKQIVNSSKVWTFFGYQYLIPLWDNKLTDFFASMPFEWRVYKNLYDETLKELFAEHELLLEHEITLSLNERKKLYLRMKKKEYFYFLTKIKRKKKSAYDFFYFEELVQPMLHELKPFDFNNRNGILSAWYIQHLMNCYK